MSDVDDAAAGPEAERGWTVISQPGYELFEMHMHRH